MKVRVKVCMRVKVWVWECKDRSEGEGVWITDIEGEFVDVCKDVCVAKGVDAYVHSRPKTSTDNANRCPSMYTRE